MARASGGARKRVTKRIKPAREKLPAAIGFKRKAGGKDKETRVSTGFAWDLFLFAGAFGLPLFWRRLPQWGAIVLALWCVVFVIGRVPASDYAERTAELVLSLAFLGIQVWLGFKGNRLTAKALIAHGWTLERPGDAETKRVVERWGLAA